MVKTNPGWVRLSEICPVSFRISDLDGEIKTKIKDTVRYSMNIDPNQNKEQCIERCIVAIFTEYYVANWMDGYVNTGIEDISDPYTYAYDVLSHPKYSGLRIEVKTHYDSGGKDWIHVSSGLSGIYPETPGCRKGLNIGPFLNYNVADLIIIFKYIISDGEYIIRPYILSDKESLDSDAGTVCRSRYPANVSNSGWYLSGIRKYSDECYKLY